MSTITIGSPSIDLTAITGAHSAISADPDVFAAQLQSATGNGLAVTAPPTGVQVDSTGVLASLGTPTLTAPTPSDASVTPATTPAGVTQPEVAASLLTGEAVPTPPTPVARPDEAPTSSAISGSAIGTTPVGSPAVGSDDPAVVAPQPAAATDAPAPGAGKRIGRHTAVDTLPTSIPTPIPALSAVGLTPVVPIAPSVANGVVADGSAAAGPAAPAASVLEDETSAAPTTTTTAIATSAAMGSVAIVPPAPPRRDDGREQALPSGAVPVAAIPASTTLVSAAPLSAANAVANVSRPAVRVIATTATDPRAFAAALAQPALSHTAETAAPAAPATPPQPAALNTQLVAPLLSLRNAGAGTHVLTLTVSPESIGPVTVRAHVTDGLMRVELSAPTDQGTSALHAMLPDLKRDLSQGGVNSALTIASAGSDGTAAGNQNTFGGAGGFSRDDRPSSFRTASTAPVVAAANSTRPISVGATSALDVLA